MAEISGNGHGDSKEGAVMVNINQEVELQQQQKEAIHTTKSMKKQDSVLSFSVPFLQKLMAEILGTYFLIFAGCASVAVNAQHDKAVTLPGIAIVWGLTVMVLVYSLGHISGAHFNPAVTIAFASCGRFPLKQVPAYVISQVIGSTLAAATLRLLFGLDQNVCSGKHDVFVGTLPSGSDLQSFVIEFIITFYLMFIISGVATDNRAVSISKSSYTAWKRKNYVMAEISGNGHGDSKEGAVMVNINQEVELQQQQKEAIHTTKSMKKQDSVLSFSVPFLQKLMAEILGTYFLIFAGCASVAVNAQHDKAVTLPGIAIVWGLTVMVLVYSLGHISGAHFNPAVTIAFASCGRFPLKQVPAYVISQVIGSTLAAATLRLLFGLDQNVCSGKHDVFVGTLPSGSDLQSFVIEFIITFYLMFIISGVATDNRAVSISKSSYTAWKVYTVNGSGSKRRWDFGSSDRVRFAAEDEE
ncbi:hypothetical protein F2Q68_00037152 [Brassica cretica]|uniref:Aquaporin n=1 Tax=Brassica cretica TaxID=69181 RepID=A0A8S9H2J6_BRACR|nr:hypothetical protein F2Q68_00037152 [Brassica cretica]